MKRRDSQDSKIVDKTLKKITMFEKRGYFKIHQLRDENEKVITDKNEINHQKRIQVL